MGVIDGISNRYVPDEYATLGWSFVFIFTIVLVAYWGTIDGAAVPELQDPIEEIETQGADDDSSKPPTVALTHV